MGNAAILYVLDAILAVLVAKLKTDGDPVFQDLLTRLKSIVAERRNPTAEDEAALKAFLDFQRSRLHS